MSQATVGQSQRNEPVGGDTGRPADRIASTNQSASVHSDAPHFGIFHDEVQNEVQRLKDGLATVDSAIDGLTKTFRQHGKIVQAVGKRWGKDQMLEDEIRDLKVAKDDIWKHIEKDRAKYHLNISKLEEKHAEELALLQTKADAGTQEKEKYEEMERRLEDQHNHAQEKLDTDFKQRKTQLEKETTDIIETLRREKKELDDTKAKLEHELRDRTKELDQEKETRTTMQDKLWKDIDELQNTLGNIKAKYQLEKQPSEFYLNRYRVLVESVGKIATSYFTDLPDKAIDDPVRTSTQLTSRAPSFAKIPIAESECSQVLRLANVQHLIFTVICDSLWQPFFSKYIWKQKGDRLTLEQIYSRLADYGEDVQKNWKVATLKTLNRLDNAVDVGEQVDVLIEGKVIACLQPLLDDSLADQFKYDLKVIFTDAIGLGKIAECDQSPVYIDKNPPASDRDGWNEYLSDDYGSSSVSDLSASSPAMDSPPGPLFVNPRIFRLVAKPATTSVTATAATTIIATTSQLEVEMIQPGLALFPGTGIFQEGASDWQKISNAAREAARNINGKTRRQSLSASMTNSGILPRSPTQPSKRWSRHGTQEFD